MRKYEYINPISIDQEVYTSSGYSSLHETLQSEENVEDDVITSIQDEELRNDALIGASAIKKAILEKIFAGDSNLSDICRELGIRYNQAYNIKMQLQDEYGYLSHERGRDTAQLPIFMYILSQLQRLPERIHKTWSGNPVFDGYEKPSQRKIYEMVEDAIMLMTEGKILYRQSKNTKTTRTAVVGEGQLFMF